MIREVGSLMGTRVLEFESGETLASVNGAIVHPDTGMVEAFWVKPTAPAFRGAIVQVGDIVEFKKHIYIKSENVIAPAEDVIRITEILNGRRFFIGNRVENESGDLYGRCYDLTFDTKSYALKQIYVQKTFLGLWNYDRRIFSYDNIIRVTADRIIIDDKTDEKESVIATTPEAAAG